ncbi:uncharacterized protein LOC125369294 [Ricinus communis]|uniref:uncharacterized protein LOC125369294 n=1 Tax=Ricinus communis TaxID=3988 RepID=UPI00201AB539|nr:uncharacterized protein LOC125369294 [Ricinus communis]
MESVGNAYVECESDDYPFIYLVDEVMDEVKQTTKIITQVEDKLTERVIEEFIMFHANKRNNASPSSSSRVKAEENGEPRFGEITKKKRSGARKRKRVVEEGNWPSLSAYTTEHQQRTSIAEVRAGPPERCFQLSNDVGVNDQNLSKKRKMNNSEEVAWPSVLRRTVEEKGGSEVNLLITKKLTNTDIAKTQNRVSIPLNQVKNNGFLRDEEIRMLNERDGKHLKGINVMFVGPSESDDRKGIELSLRKWNMKNNSSYNLATAWYPKVVTNNMKLFQNNPTVQFWTFRCNGDQLWFQLVIVKDEEDGANSTPSTNGDHQAATSSTPSTDGDHEAATSSTPSTDGDHEAATSSTPNTNGDHEAATSSTPNTNGDHEAATNGDHQTAKSSSDNVTVFQLCVPAST